MFYADLGRRIYRVEWAALTPVSKPSEAKVEWRLWFLTDSLRYLPPCTARQSWRIIGFDGIVRVFFHPRLEACREYLIDGNTLPGRPSSYVPRAMVKVRLRPLILTGVHFMTTGMPGDPGMEYLNGDETDARLRAAGGLP